MDKQPAFPSRKYGTLINVLQEKVIHLPDQVLYTFLSDGETEDSSLTYRELDRQARGIAAMLQRNNCQPGERVLLLFPPGLEYISAFWGCLYAGMVAVPSYPPRLNRPDPRLQTIARDSRARVALTTPQILASIEQRLTNTPDLASIRWLTPQGLDVAEAEQWQMPQSTGDSLAFLQYTSGSTAQPKGVMVSHSNLVHNLEKIHQFFGMTPQSRGVIWLPPYHDMGLIGGLLESLYAGITTVLMPPTAFLQKPTRWLQAISRYRGTVSGGPNFAYEFCIQKVTDEQKQGLDLSSWKVAFTGAEPIQKETLQRFAKTFEPYGFRREAFYACYGLAEATLIATGGVQNTWPTVRVFAGDELTRNRAVLAEMGEPNPRELVSSGAPATDQKLLIVDAQTLQPCPNNQVGEIWLAGPSIARGYWDRPEETVQTFQAHLAGGGEGPFMRTGDLGFIHDGEVFIAGRAKDLIIIRGRNHYPQDIELTVDGSHPAVAPGSGAAFSVEIQGQEKLVIVQEVERHTKAEDFPGVIAAIRQAVVEQHELQAYAVVLIRTGSIPRTSSFKIQRHACKAQYLDGSLTVLVSNVLETETLLTESPERESSGQEWDAIRHSQARLTVYLQEQAARVLRVPVAQIDPQKPLSLFGLDSIAAVELKYALETALQISLPLEDFLQNGSISELAARILEANSARQSSITALPDYSSDAPLSHGQRALWFLHQLAPNSAAYHIPNAARLFLKLDIPALKHAFQGLAERHPALRTTFPVRGEEPIQRVLDQMEIPVETRDVSAWNRAQIDDFLAQQVQHSFDLEHGPLLRVVLLSLSAEKHFLLIVAHHIICDFWSLAILADELGQRYAAESGGAAFTPQPFSLRYSDYVHWQSGVLAGAEGERLLAYWQQKLKGELPALDLPTDHPRPPVQTYRGSSQSLRVDGELARKLKDIGQHHGATLYMTLLAAFQVLLFRYTGQTDILVGSPTSGRSRAEFAHLVGYFVNPVTLRADLSNNPPFDVFLAQVRQTALEAFAHQDYPFGLLVEHIQPRRDPSRSPIFQVMFALQKTPILDSPELAAFALGEAGAKLDLHGLSLESMALQQLSAQFDLILFAAETADGLGFSIQYNRDLFEENTIRRMLEQLRTLLGSIVAQPQQRVAFLPMLPASEQHLIAAWNDRQAEYPQDGCIQELFEAQAQNSPDAVALVLEKQQLTYRELNARANQLAHHLRALGVRPGTLVGLCVERSVDMLVGLLGILKAGGAYIPLDPMYPKDRLAYMLENSRAGILLTQTQLLDQLPACSAQKILLDQDWPLIAAQPETSFVEHFPNSNLAYLIYTSGSTGTPKGVQVEHRSVVNFLHSMRLEPGLDEKDVLVSVTTLAFDIAALEMFLPLTVGARLVLASRAVTQDGKLLMALMASSGVTCMQATPATWRLLVDTGWAGNAQMKILCGGEALPRDLADKLLERCGELWNMYGPTETTIWSTTCRVERGNGPIPIGHPIANTQTYILDTSGNLAPFGIPGELMIGGDGLARSYFGRPDLTAERFIPNPFAVDATEDGGRMTVENHRRLPTGASWSTVHRLYKTGDLARFRLDKHGKVFIEFLGRFDHQVKIRGFRIELSEIETVLSQHPALKTSAVAAQPWGAHGDSLAGTGKHLIAYIVPADGQAPTAAELRSFLKTKLPDYMLPSVFVSLDALPLTPNGKVNRKALPIPDDESISETVFIAPHGELEQSIAQIWKDVLNLKSVGIHDNFFDLGGHSLLMARVHHRLNETLGREISMVELFQYPTIDALVKYLSGAAPARPAHSRKRWAMNDAGGIAVVSMAGRFPGADTLEKFWENLSNGVESIGLLTDEELAAAGVDPALLADPNYVRMGAALEGVEAFDAAFFGYSPAEAEILDPQQRIFLECAWEALERAGVDSERYDGRIGVYASAGLNSYLLNNLKSARGHMQTADGYQMFIANDKDFTPTRVSYKLNLRGPSVNVQSACSSSLVAIHLACQSLLAGECDMALAGGVSINLPQKAGYLYQERGIASRDGHCRAFDARSSGTVRGDGVGIVVLKRLSDAIAQRDNICAVVRGSAINNDGALKVGYTAPSIQGQAEAIAEALEISGVDPETIGYIEAHGTGTEIGDPIEVAALTQAFGALTDKKGFCAIGSVKTNIGHLDTAAGVTGFIKTALSLQHGQILPSLHFETPNPRIDFEQTPFFVNTQLTEWKSERAPLRAGVSSFGVGGTNAHAILEVAPTPPLAPPIFGENGGGMGGARAWQLLLLSAKTESALNAATCNLAAHLKQTDQNPADVAYTLQTGRRVFNYRRMLVCRDPAEAVDALETLDPLKVLGSVQALKERPVAFLFTGQGAQYVNMGAELYQTESVFRVEIDRCADILQQPLGINLRQILYPAPEDIAQATEKINQTQFTQPALFVVEYAMSRLWMAWGLRPNALIGHSIGEYVAACLAGVFSLEDALALVAARGRLMQSLPGGVMLAAPLTEEELFPYLGPNLSLAAVNAPDMCVVSGSHSAVEELERILTAKGNATQPLHTSHAFHSAMMDPILDEFTAQVAKVTRNAPQIPCISNLTGDWLTAGQAVDPAYWASHLRQTVRYAQGVEKLLGDAAQVLLEVGPGHTLNMLAARHPAKQAEHVILSSLRRRSAETSSSSVETRSRRSPQDQQSDAAFLLTTLGKLWLAGVKIDWDGFYAKEQRLRLPLPTYPFERQRYWVDSGAAAAPAKQDLDKKKADMAEWFYVPSWRRSALPRVAQKPENTPSRWLLLAHPASLENAGALAETLLARLEQAGHEVFVARAGATFAKTNERAYTIDPGNASDYVSLLDDLCLAGKLPQTILHLWNVNFGAPVGLDMALDYSFYSLLFLAQALGKLNLPEEIRILVVSNHLHDVSGDETIAPEKAALLGPIQIIPLEYPQLRCRAIDLESPETPRLVDALLAETRAEATEPIVAWRGQHRWVQSFEALRLEESTPQLREEGVYLITGGLGGIGLALAKHMAQQVRAKLILVSKSELPPRAEWDDWLTKDDVISRKIQGVREIERAGGQVLVVAADVTEMEQMRRVVAQAQAHFGPINGVIHAAGVPGGGVIQLKTRIAVENVMAAKVRGALALTEALKGQSPDFIVLCSSINALVGRLGQVDYVAANAFLDAFVRAHPELPFISINWETWRETGMAVAAGRQTTSPLQTGGFDKDLTEGLTSAEGAQVFDRILSSGLARVVVSTRDLAARIAYNRAQSMTLVLGVSKQVESRSRHPRPPLMTVYVAPRNETEQKLAEIWQSVLGIEAIGIHDNFFELGGHSLLAVQMISHMRAVFGMDLPLTNLFEKPTLAFLGEYIETVRWALQNRAAPQTEGREDVEL